MDRELSKLLIEARDALNEPRFQRVRDFLLDAAFGGSGLPRGEVPAPPIASSFPPRPTAALAPTPSDEAAANHPSSIQFPLKIYTRRSGIRVDGLLLDRSGRIRLLDSNGNPQAEIFESPSPAAVKVLNVEAANGWAEWYYDDPATGQPRQISDLRPVGMRQVRRRR